MKLAILASAAILLASCSTAEVEPIPGSITYGGQPRTKLTKSPIGSKFVHTFQSPQGSYWSETYEIQPDRSLKIIARRRTDDFTLNANGGL